VKGKEVIVVLESKSKALATLKRLKKYGIVKTYAQGRKTYSLIQEADYCPICKKIMASWRKNNFTVPILNPKSSKHLMAHRSCCERAKVPYRLYNVKDRKNPNKIVYPK
jgi:NAD dependent epimerase/dehydratase family enzyme